MKIECVAGMDPARKRCVAVGENSAETLADFLADGLIIVPVMIENARKLFGQDDIDVYAIVQTVWMTRYAVPAVEQDFTGWPVLTGPDGKSTEGAEDDHGTESALPALSRQRGQDEPAGRYDLRRLRALPSLHDDVRPHTGGRGV
ncbi:hypothetical protein [Pseudomonas savastanoi]|uniref:hypothetical protein n=1 Tax=Pseudomonas savastanoi TaxID=29438 RepID=UPI0019670397|nr:hypothetical protein [Pseudomonas savastanoi]